MENTIQVFSFEGNNTRVIAIDGEPWFVGKDVCDALGYQNSNKALMDHVEEDDLTKRYPVRDRLGRTQECSLINESGVYALVFGSKLPEAWRFKRFVTSEVLPSIRKHGVYMTGRMAEELLMNPDNIIKIAQNFKDERTRRLALEAQVEADRPKVLFADAVECSSDSIYVNELAKLLNQNGIDIGEKRLFRWLRKNGWLMSYGRGNIPTQKAMDAELFSICETERATPDGEIRLLRTPMVTGRGQRYFINLFLNGRQMNEEAHGAH